MTIYSATQFLIQVKQKAAITQGTVGLQDSDILNIATRRLQIDVVNEILDKKEEYLLQLATVPLVASQDYYRIPYRSIASTIRHIFYVDTNQTMRFPLNRIYHEDLESFPPNLNYSIPRCFLLEASQVRIVPSVGPTPSGNLYIEYFFRPNQIISDIYCRQITAINGQTVTFASMPSQLSSVTSYDIINNVSGNEIIQFDVAGTASGNTITFSTALGSNVAVGQWVAPATQSPVPMIPEEYQELLIAYTVLDIQQLRGNTTGIQVAQQDVQMIKAAVSNLSMNRVQSKPELVIPRNPLANGQMGGQRWGRW